MKQLVVHQLPIDLRPPPQTRRLSFVSFSLFIHCRLLKLIWLSFVEQEGARGVYDQAIEGQRVKKKSKPGGTWQLVQRLYDVQTVSTVFADWPYCEYITERGGLCMLLDSMTAFPFAKFSYDAVHSSWIFHGVYPKDLFKVFHEQNRVLRPGGYMWWVGGWSREQMAAIQSYAKALGYKDGQLSNKARDGQGAPIDCELEGKIKKLKNHLIRKLYQRVG